MGGPEDGFAALELELLGEQASNLGRLGRAIEDALRALREAHGDPALRTRLIDEAAHAVWCYFVQRESIGIHRHQHAIEVYGIPGEVLARVGAVRKAP